LKNFNIIFLFISPIAALFSATHKLVSSCPSALSFTVKVKQSNYRPEMTRGFQEVTVPRLGDNGGKVVSLTHRLLLPSGNSPGTHFC